MITVRARRYACLTVLAVPLASRQAPGQDPRPSWNDGAAKTSIVAVDPKMKPVFDCASRKDVVARPFLSSA